MLLSLLLACCWEVRLGTAHVLLLPCCLEACHRAPLPVAGSLQVTLPSLLLSSR